jgi:hypothetical protein
MILFSLILITLGIDKIKCDNIDILIDTKATTLHRIDSLNLLIYCESEKMENFPLEN